tara:strand:- start:80 stop:1138 length:1059 start_codon:yes stop_codon:yes gene_type:complete
LPTDISVPGPWHGKDDHDVRKGFAAHIKAHPAFPERFAGVAIGVKPPLEQHPRIVLRGVTVDVAKRGELSLDANKRNDCWVPCNGCGPEPKFFKDGDLIRNDNGWLFLLGKDCGEKHFGQSYAEETQRFHREEQRRRARDFLTDQIEHVAQWRACSVSLQPTALEAAHAHATLNKTPTFVREVRQAILKDHGKLKVWGSIQRREKNGGLISEPALIDFGRVTGAAAVGINSDFLIRLQRADDALAQFGPSDETALDRICQAEAEDELPELASQVRQALTETHNVRTELAQFSAFFSKQNLATLKKWLKHRDCPIRLLAFSDKDVWWFKTHEKGTRNPIDTTPFRAPLPNLPQ